MIIRGKLQLKEFLLMYFSPYYFFKAQLNANNRKLLKILYFLNLLFCFIQFFLGDYESNLLASLFQFLTSFLIFSVFITILIVICMFATVLTSYKTYKKNWKPTDYTEITEDYIKFVSAFEVIIPMSELKSVVSQFGGYIFEFKNKAILFVPHDLIMDMQEFVRIINKIKASYSNFKKSSPKHLILFL